MRLVGGWIGKECVVRSVNSGVWLGVLKDAEGDAVLIENAVRAWQWQGAGSCTGLATTGPTGGKLTVAVPEVTVFGVCEVIPATEKAVKAWRKAATWTGRERE